jgi:hypothetical protein
MFETSGFLLFLSLTVVGVVMTLVSGLQKRRRPHIVRAVVTVALLAVTILFAFLMAGVRVFPAREMAIHRVFSVSVAVLVPLVAASGILLARRPTLRWPHRACVSAFLVMAVGALVTGVWVLWLSSLR